MLLFVGAMSWPARQSIGCVRISCAERGGTHVLILTHFEWVGNKGRRA